MDELTEWISARFAEDEEALAEAMAMIEAIAASQTELSEGFAAKVAELESAVSAGQATITDLKARNYDLLTQVSGEPADDDTATEGDEQADGEITIDDLFEEEN